MGQVLQARRGPGARRARRCSAPASPTRRPATTINRVCGSGLKSIMFAAGGDPGGRRRRVRRGRHGVDEQRAVPAAQGALRLPPRQRDARGQRGARRAVVRGRGLPHGHPRRAGRDPATTCRARTRTRSPREPPAGRRRRSTPAGSTPRWRRSRSATRRAARRSSPSTRARAATRRSRRWRASRPVFALPEGEDRGAATVGTVTAGNAPGITDGAAATVVASERAVERLRADAARADRRLRPGRGGAQVAVPRAGRGRARTSRRGPGCRSTPSTSSRSTRRSPRRRWPTGGSSASTGRRSTSTAARSRWATRSGRAARGSSRRCSTSWRGASGRYGLATLCLGGGGSVAMAFERVGS